MYVLIGVDMGWYENKPIFKLIVMRKIHRHSDIEVLKCAGVDIYHSIGQIHSLRSRNLLTVNKTVNLEWVLAFRGGVTLKGHKKRIVKAYCITYESISKIFDVQLDVLLHQGAKS